MLLQLFSKNQNENENKNENKNENENENENKSNDWLEKYIVKTNYMIRSTISHLHSLQAPSSSLPATSYSWLGEAEIHFENEHLLCSRTLLFIYYNK